MDPAVVHAAEQQMRRTAPTQHGAKRQRVDDGNAHESVARFNYASPLSLEQGAAGFIVTCSFRREKSATKEAVTLLSQYIGQPAAAAPAAAAAAAAATATATHVTQDQDTPAVEKGTSAASHSTAQHSTANLSASSFSLTKLSCNGVIMLQLNASTDHSAVEPSVETSDSSAQAETNSNLLSTDAVSSGSSSNHSKPDHSKPVEVVQKMLLDLEAGNLKAPQFCERIIPVQTTCQLSEKALQAAADRLAAWHAQHAVKAAGDKPVSFAVAYKGRGNIPSALPSGQAMEQAAHTLPVHQPSNQTQPYSSNHMTSEQQQQQQEPQTQQPQDGLVDQEGPLHSKQHKAPTVANSTHGVTRGQSIATVAASIEAAIVAAGGSVLVDLMHPEVVVVLEMLPLSVGVFCALSWVPAGMTMQTPRRAVKTLISPAVAIGSKLSGK